MIGWVDTGNISLRYSLEGDAANTVVFLHEAGGCLESWDAVVARLHGRIRTLAYDSRGAGLSEKPVGKVTIDDFVDDLVGLLDALELKNPVTVVGCAVGAAVGIRFVSRFPARATALVALAPATCIDPSDRSRIRALADRLESQGVRPRMEERFDHSYALRYVDGRTDRPAVRARLLLADPHGYAQLYRMLCDLDLTDDLARIATPTLVVAGRHDGTRPPEAVGIVAGAIAGARYAIIDSGHVMNVLSPTLVAEQIATLLTEVYSTERRP